MAQLISMPADTRKRPGVRRGKKHSLKTDMTPMVDLGFLLITFFVFTAKLSEPVVMNLNMPKESTERMKLGKSSALTILLDRNDAIFYYHGDWQEAKDKGEIYKTSFSPVDGMRKLIIEKQQALAITDKREGRDALMLLIKASDEATYKNMVDALDEAVINGVKKYIILKPMAEESRYLKEH
jgi:biopolymer transport protein ExbD